MARPIATHDNTFTKAYLQQHCGDLLSFDGQGDLSGCLLYTSPSPRDS